MLEASNFGYIAFGYHSVFSVFVFGIDLLTIFRV